MKILTSKKIALLIIILTFAITKTSAQTKSITVNQNQRVDQLLNEKRKINTSLVVNDRYKIQIFSGVSELAKKTLNEFKLDNIHMDATIVFQTPNYKVWVGNYRTRMEAERNLIELQNKYKNILLIKPSR
ncbi:SPOR domain-containing protein [Flavobacterium sp. RSSA_27]|uniref:SPOR domain-containing protein n=1 Tax=Flavobacterium sp. RSSA_27 TaxID=3447667 RepID=UPI003F32532C